MRMVSRSQRAGELLRKCPGVEGSESGLLLGTPAQVSSKDGAACNLVALARDRHANMNRPPVSVSGEAIGAGEGRGGAAFPGAHE